MPFLALTCVFGNDLPVLTVSTHAPRVSVPHTNKCEIEIVHSNRHPTTYRSSGWKIFPTQPSLPVFLVVSNFSCKPPNHTDEGLIRNNCVATTLWVKLVIQTNILATRLLYNWVIGWNVESVAAWDLEEQLRRKNNQSFGDTMDTPIEQPFWAQSGFAAFAHQWANLFY